MAKKTESAAAGKPPKAPAPLEVVDPQVLPPVNGITYEKIKESALEVATKIITENLDGYRSLGQIVATADKAGGKEWIRQLSVDLEPSNLGVSVPNLYKMQQYALNVSPEHHEVLKAKSIGWGRAAEIGQNAITPQLREKIITDLEDGRVTPAKLGTTLKAAKEKIKGKKAKGIDEGDENDEYKSACKRMLGLADYMESMGPKLEDLDFKVVSAINNADENTIGKLAEAVDATDFGFDALVPVLTKKLDAIKKALTKRAAVIEAQLKAAEKTRTEEAKKAQASAASAKKK